MKKISLSICVLLLVIAAKSQNPHLLKDVFPGASGSGIQQIVKTSNYTFFNADDDDPDTDRGLFRTDGTIGGTIKLNLRYLPDPPPSPNNYASTKAEKLTAIGNKIVFAGDNFPNYGEIWSSDGTQAGTIAIERFQPTLPNVKPVMDMAALGNEVMYGVVNSSDRTLLKKTDGTIAGTSVVYDFSSFNRAVDLALFKTINNILYFNLYDVGGTGIDQLWRSDGTTAGTYMLKDFGLDHFVASFYMNAGSFFYIMIVQPGVGNVLWKSDGTAAGTVELKTIGTTGNNNYPPFAALGTTLYFAGLDAANGKELWKTDGTTAGTVMLSDINQGVASSNPSALTVLNNELYFSATTLNEGTELWKFDGVNTSLVKDINPGSAAGSPGSLVVSNNFILMRATTLLSGAELWVSDGTSSNTQQVADINPGTGSSNPNTITAGNNVYFSADNGVVGRELFKYDNTQGLAGLHKIYVNDNSTTGDVFTTVVGNNANPGTITLPVATLSYAVSIALPGDTIYVDAGAYSEQVIINKGISIIGAGQTLTFFTPPATTLVSAPGPFTEIGLIETTQGIGDVHISNISVNSNGSSQNIIIQSGGSVKNCTLLNGGQGIFFRVDPAIKTALIENNTIQPNGIGINCQGSGLTATIRNNTISKPASYYAGIFAGLDFGPLPQLTIQNNIINNFNGEGILATSFNGTYTLNSITGTGTNAINRNGNGGNTPIATCNWFGTSNATTIASKMIGTVIYSPFLTDGTDNSSNIGFQPAGSCGSGNTYYVNDGNTTGDIFTTATGNNANPGTAAAPFATLQFAVNTAAANDIINVDAGTYTEQVTITKGITIIGAGQNSTFILKPVTTVAPPGPFTEQGVIQTAQNIGEVNIKDLSVTGDNTLGVTPIIIQSGGSVRNCKLQSGNQGLFVRIDATTNPGAKTFYIEGNTIQAEYIAVNTAGTSLHAILSNNTLAAYNPGFSAGMFAGLDFGPLGRLTATNNLFNTYSTYGILISSSNASITQNAFIGVGSSAISKSGGADITANCNWYGVANVASIVPKITAGVNYYPWYVDGTDASTVAGFQHYTESCGAGANVYYVNDNNTAGDLFTTTIGNDANTGTPTSPLATFGAALTKASPGASIYMDAGIYTAQDASISKQVRVIGTNYNASPNSTSDPLLLNSTRNAESIIENTNWIIESNNLGFEGLTFNPLGKQAVTLNNTSWSDTRLFRNRFRISSNFTQLNFTGSGTTTMALSAIANWSLYISENRFEKEDASFGTTINVNRYGGVNIINNSFVVTNSTPRTQTSINAGGNGVVNYLNISNNTFDRASTAIIGNRIATANLNFNKIINTTNAFIGNNFLAESSEVAFKNNILDGSAGIFPFVQYTRQGGNATGASSSFTAEQNVITGTAVAGTTTLLGSMNLIFFNTVLNPSLTVRNNKMTYGGDLSTVPSHFIRPIMLRGNLANALVEKNEINLPGINQQPKSIGIDLPVSPAITLYTENGTNSFLQYGSLINILNNKINGFKHSFAAYDASNGKDTYMGYGNIPAGVTVNINNNSFTGDSVSINNGTIPIGSLINATCNWYGSADPAVVVPKFSVDVNYSPWLTNGTDTDPATGFQPLPNVCNGRQNKLYVNDNSQTGDIFTSSIGNDANSGLPSAPLLTINAALTKALAGDTIFVDAGSYLLASNLSVSKSITILGSNYQISPNNSSAKEHYNVLRNAESTITGSPIILNSDYINIKGLQFSPTEVAVSLFANFSHIKVEKNVFNVVGPTTSLNLQGVSTSPIVAFDFSVTDCRFERKDILSGSNINIGLVKSTLIDNNTFIENPTIGNPLRGFALRTAPGQSVEGIVFSNNFVKKVSIGVIPSIAQGLIINNNIFDSCGQGISYTPAAAMSNNITIRSNNFFNLRVGRAVLVRGGSGGGINNLKIIDNTINQSVDGIYGVVSTIQLDFATANSFSQTDVWSNRITITGDYNLANVGTNCGIQLNGKHANTSIDGNELNFNAINNGVAAIPNVLPPVPAGIFINTDAMPSTAAININNNKINGFKQSVALYDPNASATPSIGYGYLATGATVNINSNSFTGDSLGIDNGVISQLVNATCNWYGAANVAHVISKVSASTVTFSPWLTNGTDNSVSTGFQPLPNVCNGIPVVATIVASTNVSCNGAVNGAIDISVSGGLAPFIYAWTKDNVEGFSTQQDLSNLSPGDYQMVVTDANGSTDTLFTAISEPDVLTLQTSGTNNLCFSLGNGTATATATGGTSPYTYLWSNGQTTASINNLSAGLYSVVITDANGCIANASYTVTEPTLLTANATGTNNLCFGLSNGTATATATGGISPYTYLWSNGQTTASINNLSAGLYNIVITDANGCTANAAYTVTEPTLLTASPRGTDNLCFGLSNGTATATATGGTIPYTYLWSNGQTTGAINNLVSGIYDVVITDVNGCNTSASYTVTEPSLLTAAVIGTNNICFGGYAGSADVLPSGGTASYSYLWSNGGTSSQIENLAAGTYTVTVTDANGCTTSSSYEVTEPTQVTANITNSSTACSNIATVNASGGTPGNPAYSYLWSNGSTSATISGVPVGTYTVIATDVNGCTATASIILTVGEAFNPSASVTNITCFGVNNGIITITNVNGTAPFIFSKDGGVSFESGPLPFSFTNLAPGDYNIAVKDVNGCTGFVTKTVTQPTQLTSSFTVQKTCSGLSTGSINVTVSGGSPAYSYMWSGPNGYTSSQLNISNLAAGNYTLTVTDKNNCTVVVSVTVNPFPAIVVARTITDVACRGGATGSINITATGGTGSGFTYSWTGGIISSLEDLNNIAKGTYKIRVTDNGSGCLVDSTFIVTEPASNLSLTTARTNATGCNSLGTITGIGSGGTAPYSYNINGGVYNNFTGSFTGLYGGDYTIGIKDANGCTTTKTVNITDNGGDAFEGNNSKNQAKPIGIGTMVNARIALAADIADWFRFTTPMGSNSYTVSLTHPSANFTYNVFTGANNSPALVPSSTTGTSKTYSLSGNTTYYISVTGGLSFVCYNLMIVDTPPPTPPLFTKNSGELFTEIPKIITVPESLSAMAFPNPHKGIFNLKISSPKNEDAVIEIFSLLGQKIAERKVQLVKGENMVPFKGVAKGTIFYKINTDKKTLSGKIIGF